MSSAENETCTAVSLTFLEALARLGYRDARRCAAFVERFLTEHVRAGTSLERIGTDFWSARVSLGLRAIIVKYQGTWVLAYADKHDEAYAWASARCSPPSGKCVGIVASKLGDIDLDSYVNAQAAWEFATSSVTVDEPPLHRFLESGQIPDLPPCFILSTSQGTRLELIGPGDERSVGRSAACEIVVDTIGVSRLHFGVKHDGVHVSAFDLGSTNGTYLSGKRLGSEPARLRTGDTIRAGKCVLRFLEAGEPEQLEYHDL